jgi:hypothetical protein
VKEKEEEEGLKGGGEAREVVLCEYERVERMSFVLSARRL